MNSTPSWLCSRSRHTEVLSLSPTRGEFAVLDRLANLLVRTEILGQVAALLQQKVNDHPPKHNLPRRAQVRSVGTAQVVCRRVLRPDCVDVVRTRDVEIQPLDLAVLGGRDGLAAPVVQVLDDLTVLEAPAGERGDEDLYRYP